MRLLNFEGYFVSLAGESGRLGSRHKAEEGGALAASSLGCLGSSQLPTS